MIDRAYHPLFQDNAIGALDAEGKDLNPKATAGANAKAGFGAAVKDLKSFGVKGIQQMADGVGSMVSNFVLLGETGPAALKKLTAQVLASVAAEAAVKSIFYLAEGIAALFWNPAASGVFYSYCVNGRDCRGYRLGRTRRCW